MYILAKLKTYGIVLIIFASVATASWYYIDSLLQQPSSALKNNINLSIPAISLPSSYNKPLSIQSFGQTFFITPLAAQPAKAEITGENVVKYIDAYVNTDIVQTRTTYRIKEDIILKQPGHPEEFAYQIDLTKYDFVKDEEGNFIFYDKGKKGDDLAVRFAIPAPYMIDSAGLESATSDVETSLSSDGKFSVRPSKDWLARVKYPVTLDPTIEIIVLNVHSHPQQGENWTVDFTTQGQADLKIIPNDQATIDDDVFISLSCNGVKKTPQILEGDVIYFPSWQCDGEGQVVHYTQKAGDHTLKFDFGGQIAWAYNSSNDASVLFRSFQCGDTVVGQDGLTYGSVFGKDGKCWFDRNLGATQVATALDDSAAYGYLFQWGRLSDGHEVTTSDLTSTNSSTDVPGHNDFITESVAPADWRIPQNDNLWQGVDGINNPCPTGWRLPTQSELASLVSSEGITNNATAFSSSLKLPASGFRGSTTGTVQNRGVDGNYWASTISGTSAYDLIYDASTVTPNNTDVRAFGCAVRCIKDMTTPAAVFRQNVTLRTWRCGVSTISDADGNNYPTTLIDTQCWMASNLMTTKYPDGTSINRGPVDATWDGNDNGYYAYPGNVANTAEETLSNIISNKLGFVYQWSAVMHGSTSEGAQGVCPNGWHIPTDAELYILENYLWDKVTGSCASDRATWDCAPAGTKLRTDAGTGFYAPSSGARPTDGSFWNRGSYDFFWSSTQTSASNATYRDLRDVLTTVNRLNISKASGYSVRCIKDNY